VQLPSVGGLPPVASIPAPSFSPLFGMTDEEQGMLDMLPQLSGTPMTFGESPMTSGQLTLMQYTAARTGAAVGPNNDPREWTPEEAVAQTDRALARISAVNPELAQKLASERGRAEDPDGFLSSIWDGIKEGFAGVVDIISRPFHILPEVIMDWGKESVWKNVGDALSGRSSADFEDVLTEKLGMEKGILASALGFGMDLVLDPLNLVTLGAGGMAGEASSTTAAKTGIKQAIETGSVLSAGAFARNVADRIGVDLAEKGGLDQVVGAIFGATDVGKTLAEKAGSGVVGRIKAVLGRVHPDVQAGVAFEVVGKAEREALLGLTRLSDDIFRAATVQGWSRVSAEAAAQFGVDKKLFDGALRQMVKDGSGFIPKIGGPVSKAIYHEGRRAAGVLGGIRLRLPFPMFGVRLQTNALAFWPKWLDFQPARRFFAGLSGHTRAMRMVSKGAMSVDELRVLWEGGFSKLKEFAPATAKELAGGPFLHLGSALYPLSEMVGGITAHLAPSAKVVRGGGVGSLRSSDARRIAMHVETQLVDEMSTVLRPDGSRIPTEAVNRMFVTSFGLGRRVSKEEIEEVGRLVADYASVVPDRGVLSAADYWDSVIADHIKRFPKDLDTLAAYRNARGRAVQLEGQLTTRGVDALEAARVWRQISYQIKDTSLRYGQLPDALDDPAALADELRPDDAARLSAQSHPALRNRAFLPVDAEDFADGIGVWAVRDATETYSARGLHYTLGEDVATSPARLAETKIEGGVAVVENAQRLVGQEHAGRVLNPYIRDLTQKTAGAAGEATEIVDRVQILKDEWTELLRDYETTSGRSVETLLDTVEDPIVREIVKNEMNFEGKLGEIVTRELQLAGFDGLLEKTTAGDFLTVFMPTNGSVPVSRINPFAPHVAQTLGWSPRELTEEVRQAVRRAAQPRKPGATENVLRKLVRDTHGMGHVQAELHVRNTLAHEYGVTLAEGQRALVADPLKILQGELNRTAKRIKQKLLGEAAGSLDSLGLAKGAFQGPGVGLAKYRYFIDPVARRAVEGLGPEYATAQGRVMDAQLHILPELRRQAIDAADALERLEATIDDELETTLNLIAGHTTSQQGEAMAELASVLDNPNNSWQGLYNSLRLSMADPAIAARMATRGSEERLIDLGDVVLRGGERGRLVRINKLTAQGKRSTVYLGLDAEQRVQSVRSIFDTANQGVGAITAPSAQGLGWGLELLKAHWYDEGVDSFEKAMALITKQNFTPDGAKLNVRGAKWLKDDLLRLGSAAKESAQRQLEKTTLLERQALGEMNKIVTRIRTESANLMPALVPAENALNMTGMERLGVPGFENFAMPAFMAQEFKQALGGFPRLSEPHRAFRRFHSWWKEMATWLWPGFHVRNTMGAWFNNWLGGVDFDDYVATGRVRRAVREMIHQPETEWRWANTKVALKDPELVGRLRMHGTARLYGVPIDELTYGDLAALTDGLGMTANNGRAFAEARLSTEAIEARGTGRFENFTPTGLYIKSMRGAGTGVENVFRTASFIRGLKDYGDIFEARSFTMMRHGDYHDLTDTEYKFVRDVIPFYKWMRTNLPFQVHQLLENPGKLLATVKAQQALFNARGDDYETMLSRMPEWMRRQFIIPVGEDDAFKVIMLDLPMADLYMDFGEFASSTLPLVRPFLESYIFEKSAFSGAPIEGRKIQLGGAFLPVQKLMSAVGMAEKGADGKYYISDKTQNMLSMFPTFSRFRNWIYEDPDRAKLRAGSIMSAGLGLSLRPIDQDTMADAELNFYYDQVLPAVTSLRDMGYKLPTIEDVRDLYGTTSTVLESVGIKQSPLTTVPTP